MKDAIELFAALGRRLAAFGTDAASCTAIERARKENPWFSSDEIRRAAVALADQMLHPETLRGWLAHYPVPVAVPRRVLVIMAGNIPLVGFSDLLCVVAAGHRCLIKPSTKDRALIEYIVDQLLELDPTCPVSLSDSDPMDTDAVIATGSDNTNRMFRSRYAALPSLLRGSRHSAAVLSGNETPELLHGLADDIFAYSGLGCRSVSLLFLPRGYELRLDPPAMNPRYHDNYRQTRALLSMQGIPFRDLGTALLVEERSFPPTLSRIHYSFYDTISEVSEWLAAHDAELQCVVSELPVHRRCVGFGQAQCPGPTDYPDNRDVMAFLTTEIG